MATQFTITKVDYANTTLATQIWSFWYKLSSSSVWILITSTASVNPDGTLAVSLNVGSLTPGSVYNLRAANNCASPAVFFYSNVQT